MLFRFEASDDIRRRRRIQSKGEKTSVGHDNILATCSNLIFSIEETYSLLQSINRLFLEVLINVHVNCARKQPY